MKKIPSQRNLLDKYFNSEGDLQETASDLGMIILEMKREERNNGKYTKRMLELKKLADIQEQVFREVEERTTIKTSECKKPGFIVIG